MKIVFTYLAYTGDGSTAALSPFMHPVQGREELETVEMIFLISINN
jgi:hypothetical protein